MLHTQTICTCSSVASFLQHLQKTPRLFQGSMGHYLIPSHCGITLLYTDTPHLVIHHLMSLGLVTTFWLLWICCYEHLWTSFCANTHWQNFWVMWQQNVLTPKRQHHLCCLVTQSCPTLWDFTACSPPAPLSMRVPRQQYWSGLPFSSPRDLPDPGSKLHLLHWQMDSLPLTTRKAHLTHHYKWARVSISPQFCQHVLLSITLTPAILVCEKWLSLCFQFAVA